MATGQGGGECVSSMLLWPPNGSWVFGCGGETHSHHEPQRDGARETHSPCHLCGSTSHPPQTCTQTSSQTGGQVWTRSCRWACRGERAVSPLLPHQPALPSLPLHGHRLPVGEGASHTHLAGVVPGQPQMASVQNVVVASKPILHCRLRRGRRRRGRGRRGTGKQMVVVEERLVLQVVVMVTWLGLCVHWPSTMNLYWKTPSEGRAMEPS